MATKRTAKKTAKKRKKEKWIQNLDKGGLHRSLGIPEDQKIPPSLIREKAKSKGKVGAQARAALNLEKVRPKPGEKKRKTARRKKASPKKK